MELQQILFIREDSKREKEETIGGTNRKQITKMVKKKNQGSNICCPQETYFKYKDTQCT